jgi:hypothetical protein
VTVDEMAGMLRNEIHHAEINDHMVVIYLGAEPVPGVRIDNLNAILERFEAEKVGR